MIRPVLYSIDASSAIGLCGPACVLLWKTSEAAKGGGMSERVSTTVGLHRPRWLDEFRAFIMRGNVIDLAVGIVIGAAFTGVVNSFVKDILTPLLGLLFGGIDFTNIFLTLKGQPAATLADAQKAGAVTWNIGLFLNAAIQFLIVSFAIFWLIKALTRMHLREEAAAPPPPKSEVLLEEIRDLLAAKRP
jgi:large conductance mechanosensitive channel